MDPLTKDTKSARSGRAIRSIAPVVLPTVIGDPTKRTSTRLASAAQLAPTSPGPSRTFHPTSPPHQAPETPTKAKGVPTCPLVPPSPSKLPPGPASLKPPHEFGYSEVVDPDTNKICELSVIGSSVHEKRAHTNQWSWLHQFELARYFHAGVPQGAVRLDRLPGKVLKLDIVPVIQQLYDYLQELGPKVARSKESLFQEIPQCESLEEMQAAFKRGTIQFTATISFAPHMTKPTLALNPPSVEGMGNRFSRRYGSDRFLRVRIDDTVTKFSATQPSSTLDTPSAKGVAELRKVFGPIPLVIFGRRYRPFCNKDGAMVFWCESGPGLETIPLFQFLKNHISPELNPTMSIAKFRSRFELGLSTSTPTTRFPRNKVLRVPDILSDSLTVSHAFLGQVCDILRQGDLELAPECLPDGYVPTAIQGSYRVGLKTVTAVWRLDFSTIPVPGRSSDKNFIQLYQSSFDTLKNVVVTFTVASKDGRRLSSEISTKTAGSVEWVVSPRLNHSNVMTDGCGLISFEGMLEARVALQAAGVDTPRVPNAAQARCGPAKGVWAVAPDNLWPGESFIEVRDSQWKYDDSQTIEFEFEVLNTPHGKESANIGKQTFEVLGHAGVDSKIFSDLLRAHLEDSANAMLDWTNPPALLREIELKSSVFEDRARKARLFGDPASLRPNSSRDGQTDPAEEELAFVLDGRLDPLSGAPNTIAEVAVEMLQSGFDPNTSPLLASKVKKIVSDYVASQIQFKIQSRQCRTVLVIADHLGLLQEGQIFFQSSEPIVDANGFRQRNVVTGPILVSRPPCLQPCDVQKFEAVFLPEYAHLFDVIVMSVHGELPACSILSGGDYDGDKLLLILIESIIDNFDSTKADPSFATPPFKDEEWFQVDRRKVKDIIQPLVDAQDSGALAQILSETFFTFSSFSLLAGAHNSLSYTLGLAHATTREAAHILAKSLDGRKQGFSHTPDQWQRIKQKFKLNSAKPTYVIREDTKNFDGDLPDLTFAERPKHLGKHPLDALSNTGKHKLESIRRQFETRTASNVLVIDDDLADAWRTAFSLTTPSDGLPRELWQAQLLQDLQRIIDHVNGVYCRYKEMRMGWAQQLHAGQKVARASPSKSPTKPGAWKGSSRGHKQDLLDITEDFWRILHADVFVSPSLLGPGGPETARTLLASCAYLLPVSPNEFKLAPTSPHTLLDKFRNASRSTSATTPSRTATADTAVPPTQTGLDDNPFASTQSSMTYSQVEIAEAGILSPSTTRTTRSTSTVSHGSTSPSKPLPSKPGVTFNEAMKHAAYLFCLDVAHRDIVGLKADAVTRRVHPGARGLQAPKLTPRMHTVVGVKNKGAAGLVDTKKRTRPRTLLPPPEEPTRPSPSKRSKSS